MFREHVLPALAWHFYGSWIATWRQSIYEHPLLIEALRNREPMIFAHWHGDELAVLSMVRRYGLATMTSLSRDGMLIDGIIKRFGGKTSRGSSSRDGASALRGLVRLCREGHPASVAVDGPRGPAHQVKPGVFELSRLAGARIFPSGVSTNRAIVFRKSWNRAYLPHLFSRVGIHIGEPLALLTKNDDPKDPLLAKRLQGMLHEARGQAARSIGEPAVDPQVPYRLENQPR